MQKVGGENIRGLLEAYRESAVVTPDGKLKEKEESIQQLSMKNANVPEWGTGSYGRSAGTRRSAASGIAPSPHPSTGSIRNYRSSIDTRAATHATW